MKVARVESCRRAAHALIPPVGAALQNLYTSQNPYPSHNPYTLARLRAHAASTNGGRWGVGGYLTVFSLNDEHRAASGRGAHSSQASS